MSLFNLKSASNKTWPDFVVDGVSGLEEIGEPEQRHHREGADDDEEGSQAQKGSKNSLIFRSEMK
jgi:hypothetical protein